MLIQQTIDLLRNTLRCPGAARNLEEQLSNPSIQDLGFEDRTGMMVDAEVQDRKDRKQQRLQRTAKLKDTTACPEDIDYRAKRGLDRQVVANLITCNWIERNLNTIITGPTGVGKTWLGCAFGQQATRKGFSVIYKRLSRLLEELEIAVGDGSIIKLRNKLAKVDLLILDDWALAPMSNRGRHELLELIDDRIGSGSILITSQLPVDQWHAYIGEPTVADAMLDRLVHRSHRIELRGESLRKHLEPPLEATAKE